MSISSTRIDHAEIRFHAAADALRPFVGCFWVITADRDATIRSIPDGSTAISIEIRENQAGLWSLRGPLVRPDERRFESPTTLVGIRLLPGVAFLVSRIPTHTIVGRRIGIYDVAAFRDLGSDQFRPDGPEHYINALERFLVKRLECESLHDVVATALGEIQRERGNVRVPDIAARCRVSSRHLNRLMRVWAGYGPKRYASIVRFQQILSEMEHGPGAAAALASENGYFDQAHLTLDVGRFAGATPGRLVSRGMADFSKTFCDGLPRLRK
jgi:AraC-like DNA-binding protein